MDDRYPHLVGRADALIKASGDVSDLVEWRTATSTLEMSPHHAISQMIKVLHRALASAELRAPPSVKGTFIPVGNSFDAFAALAKVLQTATNDVLIVDPYLDETALTEFGGFVPEGVRLQAIGRCRGSQTNAGACGNKMGGSIRRAASTKCPSGTAENAS